jgi:hypothetical protein
MDGNKTRKILLPRRSGFAAVTILPAVTLEKRKVRS